ncbi:transposase, partial [Facklamia sp. P12945]|uniref:transposase n=1 Tax=Facklamia sp. P12945 TaxID=3421950 RepID=UPI003D182AA4
MMSTNAESKTFEARHQMAFHALEDLVPEEHLLRKIDRHIDFSFIYGLVEDVYCLDNGRPSIDPVTLIKIPIIQYLFGIPSMRQTIQEIQVNVAYRWFLGLSLTDPVPHFSTFGKNYKRRFEGTSIAQQIFSQILTQCFEADMIDSKAIFIDGTHVKACANGRKYTNEEVIV